MKERCYIVCTWLLHVGDSSYIAEGSAQVSDVSDCSFHSVDLEFDGFDTWTGRYEDRERAQRELEMVAHTPYVELDLTEVR